MNYHTIARYAITFILSLTTMVASAQLSGVKTIDPTGSGANNYTSFQAAFNALNTQGVTVPGVTFLVAGGTTFTEGMLTLTATGTASAPIVFKKFGGASNVVILSAKNGTKNNQQTNGDQPLDNDAFIKLVGSDYVTFDGIDLVDATTFTRDVNTLKNNMEFGFYLTRKSASDACQNITIQNCKIHFALDTADVYMKYSVGVYQSPYTASGSNVTVTDTNGRCQNMVYKNISFKRMTSALWLESGNSSNVQLYNDRNIQIINCEFRELAATCYDETFSYYSGENNSSIYAEKQNQLLISDNTFADYDKFRSDGRYGSASVIKLAITDYASARILKNTFKIQPWMSDLNKATGYSFINYQASGSVSGVDNGLEIAQNTFDSCMSLSSIDESVLEKAAMYYTGTANLSELKIHDNTIKHSRGFMRGASIRGYSKLDMYNNIYYDHIGGALYAFDFTGSNNRIWNNSWYDIEDSSFIYLLNVYPYGSNCEIYSNKIYNLRGSSLATGGVSIRAFSLSGHSTYGSILKVYNNEISDITTKEGRVEAIYFTGSNTTNYVYNNTIYLNNDQYQLGYTPYTSTVIYTRSGHKNFFHNNIFVNTSSGGSSTNLAMYQNGGTFSSDYIGNNNIFYTGPNNPLVSDNGFSVANNFEEYLGFNGLGSNDAYSLNMMPPFKNVATKPYNLEINGSTANRLESSGYNGPHIFSLSTDINGDARPGPAGSSNGGGLGIDIGADEFDGKPMSKMSLKNTVAKQITKNIFPSDEKQEILRVRIETEGYLSPKSLDSITFKPTGTSNLANIKNSTAYLFWGKRNGVYSKASMISSAVLINGQFAFEVEKGLLEGNNYFWVSYDINSSATTGASFDAELESVVIDGNKYLLFGGNPVGNRTIDLTPMAGTYTIGNQVSTNHFESLTEAAHNLKNRGVSATVNLVLTDSLYAGMESFPINFYEITGASNSNRINIYPAAGNTDVKIKSPINQNIVFFGGDYYTLNGAAGNVGTDRNLSIYTGNPVGGAGVVRLRSLGIGQGCMKDTVMNCNVVGSTQSNFSDWGILLDGSNSLTNDCISCEYGASNDSNVIKNNKITDVYYGVYAAASRYSNHLMHGNRVIGNEIGEDTAVNPSALTIERAGIYMFEQSGCIIKDNKIRNTSGYSGIMMNQTDSSLITNNDIANVFHTGIWLGSVINGNALSSRGGWVRNTTVSNNKIYNVTPNVDRYPSNGFAYPIVIAGEGNGQATKNKIINNFISKYESFGTGSFKNDGAWGIAAVHGDSDLIAHNTIVASANLDSTGNVTQPCGGILVTESPNRGFDIKNIQVLNNIVDIDFRTSNSLMKCPSLKIDYAVPGSATNVDWNNFIAPDSSNSYVAAVYKSIDYPTVSDWKNTGFGMHSFNEKVQFASNTDLHLTGQSVGNAALRVDHLTGVPADIDGNTRFVKASYVGADENGAELMQTVDAGADATICKGETTALSTTITGQRSVITYTWIPATGLSNASSDAPKATPASTTQYVVKITDIYNDDYYDTVVVNVRTAPSTNITGNTMVCGSTPVALNAAAGMSKYAWSNGDTTQSTIIGTSGNYKLKVTDVDGCSDSAQIAVTQAPATDASFSYTVKNLATYEFAAVIASGVSYSWDVDGNKYTQAKPMHTFNNTGFKDVELIVVDNVSGCTDTSDRVIDIQITTDVNNVPNGKGVRLYPNPVKDHIWVRGLSHSLNGTWTIKDYSGRTVMKGDSKSIGSTGIVVSDLASGIYLLQVSEGDNIVNFKFVRQD